MITLDIHQIMEYLPHRYPFLLIDRVIELDPGVTLKALKNVTVNEPFFQGHFPVRPVFPGVMTLEAMAQASAILAASGLDKKLEKNIVYLFAGVDKARFKRAIEPGDQIVFEIELIRQVRNVWKCGGTASVDGALSCSAEVLFTYREL